MISGCSQGLVEANARYLFVTVLETKDSDGESCNWAAIFSKCRNWITKAGKRRPGLYAAAFNGSVAEPRAFSGRKRARNFFGFLGLDIGFNACRISSGHATISAAIMLIDIMRLFKRPVNSW
jgi:hypothetical protein